MSKIIRWGILGSGNIAHKFASDLKWVKDARLIAIGSRTKHSADNFAKEFNLPYSHDSYEALVANREVDVIYIATPHSFHYENTLLCLNNGKAVLCEKAFAINYSQAKQMIDLARDKGIFLMEALWTKFLPHYNKLKEIVNEGLLGEMKSMQVNFGFRPLEPVNKRIFDPALGGGTMLDIGIYNVFLALSVLGKPDNIEAVMTPAVTGIDAQCSVLFRYKNGVLVQLFSSFCSNLATEAYINGTKGRIRLTDRFYAPQTTIEFYPDKVDSKTIIPFDKEADGSGYQYEARHVTECLQQGLTESPVMTHADTLLLMETLDQIRLKAGIYYPEDDKQFAGNF